MGSPDRIRFFQHKLRSYFEAGYRHRHGEPEQQPEYAENAALDSRDTRFSLFRSPFAVSTPETKSRLARGGHQRKRRENENPLICAVEKFSIRHLFDCSTLRLLQGMMRIVKRLIQNV